MEKKYVEHFQTNMVVHLCTMPTQHGTTEILFPKLTAQLEFPKIQIIYIYIYIYIFKLYIYIFIYIFVYIKRPIAAYQ